MSRLSNRTIILGFAILAVLSLTFGILNYHKALPEIGIDFKVSRAEALQNAREFMASRRYEIEGFKEHIQFSYAEDSKIYLERELGVERFASLAEDSLDVWHWTVRFFKPLQKLEYRVMLDPKGRPVAFRRDVPESLPGPTLDTLAAQMLAEAFISGPMALNLDKWQLIETGVQDRPARRDYIFTYELKDFKAKEATYRLETIVQGAEVSGFRRFLREPEDWWRGWEKQRSQNELFQTLAQVAAFLTFIGILFYFVKHIKQNQIHWRMAFGLGGALAVAHLIMELNSIPLSLGDYQTTQAYSSFLMVSLLNSFLAALGQGVMLALLIGAGEWLYRQDYPAKLSLAGFFTKRGMKSQEFFQATVMGYLLCAFDVGLVVAIYMLGSKVGFWSPADIKYDETVSTVLPWIYPLAISLGASLLEEFWFRLFGISLFKRLTKSTALAIIIPAFIWGFLHSSYPQQPGFARGLEVGIVGIIAGVVMLRFGIWATLVYHYLFDAVMIGLFLFRSHDVYFWASGLIVCGFLLAPAVFAGIIYLRKRKFEEVEDLLNRNVLQPKEDRLAHYQTPAPEHEAAALQPQAPFQGKMALVIGVIGIALTFIPGPREFGDNFTLAISREEAIENAKQDVQSIYGVQPDNYQIGVMEIDTDSSFVTGGASEYVMSYLKRYGTLDDAERIVNSSDGPYKFAWGIRFQREYDPTEFNSVVPMEGRKITTYLQIADSLAGADLSADSARGLATAAFEKGEPEAAKFHLIEEKPIKRPNRRDWLFTWETVEPILKEAHYRRNVTIKGDIVTLGNRWVKVPEEWERSENELNLETTLINVIVIISLIVMSGWILVKFGKVIKKGEVIWRDGFLPAVLVFIASLVAMWNNSPTFWADYESSKPISNYFIEHVLTNVISSIATTGFVFVLVVLAQALASGVTGRRVSIFKGNGLPSSLREDTYAALGVAGVILGLQWLFTGLTGWFDLPLHSWEVKLPESFARQFPFVDGLTGGIQEAMLSGSLIAIVFLLVNRWANQWWKITLILFVCGLAGLIHEQGNPTIGELVWRFLRTFVLAAAIYYTFKAWIGGRLRAAAIAMLLDGILSVAGELISIRGSHYAWQGWALATIAVVVPLWFIVKGSARPPNDGPVQI